MEIYGLSRQESAKCAEAIVTAIERERKVFSNAIVIYLSSIWVLYCIVL